MIRRSRWTLIVAALFTGPSLADGAAFSIYDADQDGTLDRSEYAEFLTGQPERVREAPEMAFTSIDTDNSGAISGEEMVAVLKSRLKRRRAPR